MPCSSPVFAAGKKYALIVGVKKYRPNQPLPELTFTENDATVLAEVLQQGGYDVTLMTQTVGREMGKETLAPLATYIRDQLDAIVSSRFLTRDDMVLVALTGHGVQYELLEGENKTAKFYFCPADADVVKLKTANEITEQNQLIDLSELYTILNNCKAGGKLLLVDACRNDPTKPVIVRSANSLTLPPLPPPPGGMAAFFSCSAHEQAIEDQDLQHGVFFHHVIEGLRGDADVGNSKRLADGEITLAELSEHVGRGTYDYVRKKYQGYKQTPELRGEFRISIPLLALATMDSKPVSQVNDSSQSVTSASLEGKKAGELRELNQELGLKLVWCPAGRFKMGSPVSDAKAENDEVPQVNVELTRGFWIGQTEVTQGQWKSVMASTPWKGKANVKEGDTFPATYVSQGNSGGDQFEADSASIFCRTLTFSERAAGRLPEDWEYALPTEAEWEYACRAGTQTFYSFGSAENQLEKFAWFDKNTGGVQEKFAHAVKLKTPNPWGLYDMHGNTWEWCSDWYAQKLSGGRDPLGPSEPAGRLVRGGSWFTEGRYCRSAQRNGHMPDYRNSDHGFRVVVIRSAPAAR